MMEMIKKQRRILLVLTLFPMVITILSLFFLPEEIVTEYHLGGWMYGDGTGIPLGVPIQVGSKFILLRFLVCPILIGLYEYCSLRKQKEALQLEYGEEEGIRILVQNLSFTYVLLIPFNCIVLYGIALAFLNPAYGAVTLPMNTNYYGIFVGFAFLLLGNQLPKSGYNGGGGFAKLWAKDNELVWRKSKIAYSFSLMLGGALLILMNLLLTPNSGFYFSILCGVASFGIPWVITSKLSKKYGDS